MKGWIAFAIGLASVSTAGCAPTASGQPSVPDSSISKDEMAVYEVVLASWLDQERGQQLVNEQLSAPPSKEDSEFGDCTKGLDFSAAPPGEGKKSLAGVHFNRNGIKLIDGSKWSPADPGQGIAEGKSVDEAVREGFSKSLISLSDHLQSRRQGRAGQIRHEVRKPLRNGVHNPSA